MSQRTDDVRTVQVCRQLKANPETRLTPVVLLTGLSDESSLVLGLSP